MIILCTITALQIFSAPAGPIVVGDVPPGAPVQIQDTSMMRDWVFIGKPGFDEQHRYVGVSPRGWVPYGRISVMPVMRVEHSWVCIQINNEDEKPRIESVYGPFYSNVAAQSFARQFNDEYDGSPWHCIVRPMTRLAADN